MYGSMNMYRITGDILHIFAVLFIFTKLIHSKCCGGISGKTQFLFVLTYLTRYLDLLYTFKNQTLYMVVFKIAYIILHGIIMFLIFFVFRKSYRKKEDTFPITLLVIPCMLLAFLLNYDFTTLEITWSFSIYLESVAIVPQFYMIYKKRQVEKSLLLYLIPLGLYRLFYFFNWVYCYVYEEHFDGISDMAGLVYISVYIFALILFVAIKVELTKDEHYLKKNIFFISNNDPYSELTYEKERSADEEKILPSV